MYVPTKPPSLDSLLTANAHAGHIREFYNKGGEMLPGFKGISLTPALFEVLAHPATLAFVHQRVQALS